MAEIIPVIHFLTEYQLYKNIDTCLECGIEKIFLIDHNPHRDATRYLLHNAKCVKIKHPELWVGVNMLGVNTTQILCDGFNGIHSFGLNELKIDGVWSDVGLTDLSDKELADVKKCITFKGMFFGGLAFKYQPQPTDLKLACEKAKVIMDVATTSGVGTGKAPTRTKIAELYYHLDGHPLAIASGVSIDNIDSFKDLVQYILVASSITNPADEIIDRDKLMALNNKLK